jgi:hypothetical protein
MIYITIVYKQVMLSERWNVVSRQNIRSEHLKLIKTMSWIVSGRILYYIEWTEHSLYKSRQISWCNLSWKGDIRTSYRNYQGLLIRSDLALALK